MALLHPALAMLGFWSMVYFVNVVAPIDQRPGVSQDGIVFVGGMIALFVLSSVVGSEGSPVNAAYTGAPLAESARRRTHPAIDAFFAISIAGGLLDLIGKALAVDSLSFLGATELRYERARELLEATDQMAGPLRAAAFLSYPAGFVALLAALLHYEELSRGTRLLGACVVFLILLHAVVAGGRSTMLVLIMLIGLGMYLRACRGHGYLPCSRALKAAVVLVLVGFVTYSNAIWIIRAEVSALDIDEFLDHADQVWGVTPSARLEEFADALGEPELVRSLTSTFFYFTQSLSITERILALDQSPVLLGGYHIDVVAAAMRFLPGGASFLATGYDGLLSADIYGFFAGAWGALYLDFGLLGAAVVVGAWGWLSGRAYATIRRDVNDPTITSYAYCLYSVLISFVSPPLGFANSGITFFWFMAYHVIARVAPTASRSP